MIHKHGVVIVRGGGGIEQCRQQIGPCVPDAGAVLPDSLQDLLDMTAVDTLKPLLNEGGGVRRRKERT